MNKDTVNALRAVEEQIKIMHGATPEEFPLMAQAVQITVLSGILVALSRIADVIEAKKNEPG